MVVDQFVRALNDFIEDPSRVDVSITADNCVGPGVPVSQRSARVQENEQPVGGLRNAGRDADSSRREHKLSAHRGVGVRIRGRVGQGFEWSGPEGASGACFRKKVASPFEGN